MATLGDVKTRIISETTRDDLADDLAAQFQNIILRSIDYYATERWWFNEYRALIPTVAGQGYVLWPTTTPSARIIDGIYLEIGSTRSPLWVRSVDEWEELTQYGVTGQPSDYLVANDRIKLYPTPSSVWNLALDLIVDVTPLLAADTDANVWTNQGQDLIVAQAKIILYRDYLSATVTDQRLVNATLQEKDAYSSLRSEATRRLATGRIKPGW